MTEAELTVAAVSSLANILMAGAAVAAAIAAFMGLSTWRKQQNWQVDHELARRALFELYSYRNALYAVRHPAMSNSEMKLPPEFDENISNDNEKHAAGVIQAYSNRWEKFLQKKSGFETVLLETVAVWGKDLETILAPILELERELFRVVLLHCDAMRPGTDQGLKAEYHRILRAKRDILYDVGSDDEFRIDFDNALLPAEGFLREKLGRRIS